MQIDAIWSECYTDRAILDALDNLPTNLPETYKRCLQRVPENLRDLTIKVLQWIVSAKRPLLMKELREAVAFDIEDTEWDADKVLDRSAVISSCVNLVIEDEVDNCVRLVHPSVKQYLADSAIVASPYVVVDDQINDIRCGEFCVAYLSFRDFGLTLQKHSALKANLIVPTTSGMLSLLNLPAPASLFGRSRAPKASIFQTCLPGIPSHASKPIDEDKYGFLEYARQNWALHTRGISPESSFIWPRLVQLALQVCSNDLL